MTSTEGHIDALSQLYAGSLIDLADEAGGADLITEIGEELQDIVALAGEDATFSEFLNSVIVPEKERAGSLRRIFEGRAQDLTLRFLLVLNRKGRLGHLARIERAYRQLREEKLGYVAVAVTTALELDEAQIESIKNRLREALEKEPIISTAVREHLIGGMTLQVGDKLIDASVATRLRRLSDRLRTAGGQAVRDRASDLIESA